MSLPDAPLNRWESNEAVGGRGEGMLLEKGIKNFQNRKAHQEAQKYERRWYICSGNCSIPVFVYLRWEWESVFLNRSSEITKHLGMNAGGKPHFTKISFHGPQLSRGLDLLSSFTDCFLRTNLWCVFFNQNICIVMRDFWNSIPKDSLPEIHTTLEVYGWVPGQ